MTVKINPYYLIDYSYTSNIDYIKIDLITKPKIPLSQICIGYNLINLFYLNYI